jgi:hypothetical protein
MRRFLRQPFQTIPGLKFMRHLVLACLLSGFLPAQDCPPKQSPAILTLEVRERAVDEPIRGLTVDDLVLSGKGITPRPLGLATNLPADIAIVIEDRGRGGLLAGAADLLIKSLHPSDRIAVLTYGVTVKRVLPWSQDRAAIQSAIEKGADGAHLQVARPFYGLAEALQLFDGPPAPGRQRAIFLLGDDEDKGSNIRVEQLAANLRKAGIILDVAVDPAPGRRIPRVNIPPPTVGNEPPAMRPPMVGMQSAARLADSTGGSAIRFTGASFFAEMRARLAQRLQVSYCVEDKHAGRKPKVILSPAAAQRWPGADVKSAL